MNEINKQDELRHWGILGMRWGVRRSKKQLAKETDKKKAEQEQESEKFKTSKKKSVSKLTDDELRKETERRKLENDLQREKNNELDIMNKKLELEQKYAQLNPPKLTLGQRLFQDIWPRAQKATLDAGETLLRDGLINKGKSLLGIDGKDPADTDSKATEAASKKIDHEVVKRMNDNYNKQAKLNTKLKTTTDAAERQNIETELDELKKEYENDRAHLSTIRPKKK